MGLAHSQYKESAKGMFNHFTYRCTLEKGQICDASDKCNYCNIPIIHAIRGREKE